MKPLLCTAAGASFAILFGFHSAQVTAASLPLLDASVDGRLLLLYVAAGYGLVGGVLGFLVSLVASRSLLVGGLLAFVITGWTGWRALDREYAVQSALNLDEAIRSGDQAKIVAAVEAAWTLDFPYHGRPVLHIAVERGDYEAAQTLLRAGANPETSNSRDESPLMLAVRHADLQMVSMLLKFEAHADGRLRNDTPLEYARREGTQEVLELLSAYHDGRRSDVQRLVKRLELQEALIKGNHEEVARLIEAGVNPNASLLEGRASLGPVDTVLAADSAIVGRTSPAAAFVRSEAGTSALRNAVQSGNFEETAALVEGGADLTMVWWTGSRLESVFTVALSRQDQRLVSFLLPRMRVFLFDDLVLAAEQGLSDVVKTAIKAGVALHCSERLGVTEEECSPVIAAALGAHQEAMVALLESLGSSRASRCENQRHVDSPQCERMECLALQGDDMWRKYMQTRGCSVGVGTIVGGSFP